MPRKMDQKGVERISKALGPNDGFTRRASMTVRNGSQEEDKKEDSSEEQNVEAQKEDDDKKEQPTSN
ncbi:hypothetical protein F5X97DRAFT_313940 [Nemania serpens]|nr:hypothetical protein F5X97DRAFT_313940 [Nemania serpens]